jgi:hypothetical protein
LTTSDGKEIYNDSVNFNELVCLGDDLSNLAPTDHPLLIFQIPAATASRTLEYFVSQSDFSLLEQQNMLGFMDTPEFIKKRATMPAPRTSQLSSKQVLNKMLEF